MRLGTNKSKSIEKLIEGCRKNKAAAQRDLYAQYSSLLFAICLRYVGDSTQAEDIMISSFMKIFNNIQQYTGKGSFEGWMRKITVNESLGYIRKNKSMYLEVNIEKADYQPDYQMLYDHLEAEDLMKYVDALPIGYRTVFNLYAIEGYSHKEISEKLGININTSKSQLSRARALLQDKLAQSEKIFTNKVISHE